MPTSQSCYFTWCMGVCICNEGSWDKWIIWSKPTLVPSLLSLLPPLTIFPAFSILLKCPSPSFIPTLSWRLDFLFCIVHPISTSCLSEALFPTFLCVLWKVFQCSLLRQLFFWGSGSHFLLKTLLPPFSPPAPVSPLSAVLKDHFYQSKNIPTALLSLKK